MTLRYTKNIKAKLLDCIEAGLESQYIPDYLGISQEEYEEFSKKEEVIKDIREAKADFQLELARARKSIIENNKTGAAALITSMSKSQETEKDTTFTIVFVDSKFNEDELT